MAISDGVRKLGRTKRAKHLFSGMLTCGECGGGVIQVGKHYYGCSATRNKGTCSNRVTIKRSELEERVLIGLKDQLFHPGLIAEFVKAYQEEHNRLTAQTSVNKVKTEHEFTKVISQTDRIVDAIAEGMFHESRKTKMDSLGARKADLENDLANAKAEPPVLLHPGLADLYRDTVTDLSRALNDPATKAEATDIIRSLLTEIRLIPEGDGLAIELVGELAGLPSLGEAQKQTRPPEGGLFDSSGCGSRI